MTMGGLLKRKQKKSSFVKKNYFAILAKNANMSIILLFNGGYNDW